MLSFFDVIGLCNLVWDARCKSGNGTGRCFGKGRILGDSRQNEVQMTPSAEENRCDWTGGSDLRWGGTKSNGLKTEGRVGEIALTIR